jgi:hypothetical protein
VTALLRKKKNTLVAWKTAKKKNIFIGVWKLLCMISIFFNVVLLDSLLFGKKYLRIKN